MAIFTDKSKFWNDIQVNALVIDAFVFSTKIVLLTNSILHTHLQQKNIYYDLYDQRSFTCSKYI